MYFVTSACQRSRFRGRADYVAISYARVIHKQQQTGKKKLPNKPYLLLLLNCSLCSLSYTSPPRLTPRRMHWARCALIDFSLVAAGKWQLDGFAITKRGPRDRAQKTAVPLLIERERERVKTGQRWTAGSLTCSHCSCKTSSRVYGTQAARCVCVFFSPPNKIWSYRWEGKMDMKKKKN